MPARALVRVLALAGTALMAITTAAAVEAPARAASSALHWRACHQGDFCAKLRVPLDYRDPNGPTISIAMVKQPATDPAHRIGSIFLNPGGPGGSGIDFVVGAGQALFTPQVRARFDLIGFDPRGILASTQLRCFATMNQAASHYPPFPYPDSAKRRQQQFANDRYVESACAHRGNPILDHMATADAARDLDRMRAAVGDKQLTYYGVSYGSYLGDTYANMFPGHVRAVTIDGVLNPIAWSGRGANHAVPFSTRLHSDIGARKTLREFLRLCNAGGKHCALAPHADSKYWQLYHRLQTHPIHMGGTSTPYDQSFLISDTLGAMYDSSSWPDFAKYVKQLRATKSGSSALARERAQFRRAYAYQNFVEGFPGVACSDAIDPHNEAAWTRASANSAKHDGVFGPVWTWASSICAHWPGRDSNRFLGPFTHHTANPVLVVGNLSDPATPYQGAQTAARLLPNSRLLTVHGWGHTSLFLSHCATDKIAHYLLTSRVPAKGTVCNQDVVPFRYAQPNIEARPRTAQSSNIRFPLW
jgi:pimeloyl-ACP methyl ester carboxylesterase